MRSTCLTIEFEWQCQPPHSQLDFENKTWCETDTVHERNITLREMSITRNTEYNKHHSRLPFHNNFTTYDMEKYNKLLVLLLLLSNYLILVIITSLNINKQKRFHMRLKKTFWPVELFMQRSDLLFGLVYSFQLIFFKTICFSLR